MKSSLQTGLYLLSLTILITLMFPAQSSPEEVQPDSTGEIPDSLKAVEDELLLPEPPSRDSLMPMTFYSINDSLRESFLIDRLNLRDESTLLSPHDAADFVRFNPSNLVIDYTSVPFRKIARPFALPGDRMDVIFNNRSLSPVEHTLEPDNLVDFNDVPTAPVQDVFNIEGPAGLLFGGDNASASIILFPLEPETTRAESRMVVDNGWFGYAYTKALFARRTRSGHSIRLAAGYRKSGGTYYNSDDDAYHQWGEIIYPLARKVRVNLSGRLYRRGGSYSFKPAISDYYLNRFRRDRDLSARLEIAHARAQTSTIEFRHQRSESSLQLPGELYFRTLDIFDNSLALSHERKLGQLGMKTTALISFEKYNDAGLTSDRGRGFVDAKFLLGNTSNVLSAYFKVEKVGGFDPAPSGALVFSRNGEKLYLAGSVGYSTKFPRQYELNLVPRNGSILESVGIDYSESGNPGLKTEKQLIANAAIGLGKSGSDLMLSVTGGKILDGIDWQRVDSLTLAVGEFRTANDDIEFINITARQKFSWRDILYWSGGGSYHSVRVGENDNPPYTPDYQAFSNAELHCYIGPLDLHLYAYGEVVYHSVYQALDGRELGDNAVFNGKLSFRIKRFQFYYISQNALNVYYQAREDFTIPGRYNFYGISWEFLD